MSTNFSRNVATLLTSVLVIALGYVALNAAAAQSSPYLLLFAGDKDEADEDFMAVIDVRPESATAGRVVATRQIGTKGSMPHHTEYETPAKGQLLFANSHHHEETLLLNMDDPMRPAIANRLPPPPPYRFPHDYRRLSNGNVLVGFLRSDGPSPRPGDKTLPGGHGGIAEYTSTGEFIRSSSAAASTSEPVRTYAFAALLNIDRLVTTSAAMMEESAADVVQIWRYSDFKLLHTIPVPPGQRPDGSPIATAARAPLEPRVLSDNSVLFNSYGCGFYHLTDIAADTPRVTNVFTFKADDPVKAGDYRGACGIPIVVDEKFWLMPVAREQAVVTLDISDPTHPRESSRLVIPGFPPHWLAKDAQSDRLVLGAETGREEGMFILLLDPKTGQVHLDPRIKSPRGRVGYIDLEDQIWPHGDTGSARAHAGLFFSSSSLPP